ncbi:MAG: MutS-related protein [Lentihominibacter sp.]|jgi:DNA mismatch repair protein MutS2
MAVVVKLLANKKTRQETGLNYVISSMNLLTPFGAAMIKGQKPFLPGQEEALREELLRVGNVMEIAQKNKTEISVLSETLMMAKDNSLSIGRSGTTALSVVEIFEIKSLLLLMDKVRVIGVKLGFPAEFLPEDITGLLDTLDPGKERLNTFYIYDSFSDRLAELRREKKNLEHEIRKVQKVRKNEIKDRYGLTLTPKFDIKVSKSDSHSIEMIKEIPDLVRSDTDYMSVTFVLAPDEDVAVLIKKMDELKVLIEDEELKVREDLSREIHKYGEVLLANCDRIGKLDVTLAKALLAQKRNCVMPEITEEHVVEFTDGRHLEVEEIVRRKGGEYCPVSISLEDGVTCVTGANMGGKTVTLKLVGMVAILAQYGYFVPCERARVGLSNFIQILIGDSQSIERGLSSFGSEMEELKDIMDNSKERSLLLIDEIASGTNPVEGLALTRSIADYLKPQPYISLITTHFDTVTEDRDVVNLQVTGLANADFDRLNREIRYANRRERIAVIQRYMDYRLTRVDSNCEIPKDALNIAKMLGISKEIIENARKYIK